MLGTNEPKYEHDWIEKIQSGDDEAFAEMFRTYHARLCAFACRYVRSKDVAKDLVQDVFLSIWINRSTWSPQGSVQSYLYKAVRNQATNYREWQQVRENHVGEVRSTFNSEPSRTPLQELLHEEMEARILHAIKDLPDRCRLVFTLSRVDGLSYSEIATTLDISVNTVHTQIKRALEVLRSLYNSSRDVSN